MPGDYRLEHPGAGAVDDALEETVHLREVDVDMLERVGAEITRREVLKVGLEFLGGNFQRQLFARLLHELGQALLLRLLVILAAGESPAGVV